jgi:hypothetical protein
MLSMAPILMYSDAVPLEARAALQAAQAGPPDRRAAELETAAKAIFRATELECGEVRDLVGLPAGACG